jgi:hypothetical protein
MSNIGFWICKSQSVVVWVMDAHFPASPLPAQKTPEHPMQLRLARQLCFHPSQQRFLLLLRLRSLLALCTNCLTIDKTLTPFPSVVSGSLRSNLVSFSECSSRTFAQTIRSSSLASRSRTHPDASRLRHGNISPNHLWPFRESPSLMRHGKTRQEQVYDRELWIDFCPAAP